MTCLNRGSDLAILCCVVFVLLSSIGLDWIIVLYFGVVMHCIVVLYLEVLFIGGTYGFLGRGLGPIAGTRVLLLIRILVLIVHETIRV